MASHLFLIRAILDAMKYLSYFLFIFLMVAFISLRVYAGGRAEQDTASAVAATNAPSEDKSPEADRPVINKDEADDTADEDLAPDENEHLWHGQVEPVQEAPDSNPRIVCWGDSLTVSLDEKSAFPDILRQLSGCEVINYGVESETASMIAMRAGGLRVNVKATVIPADVTLIPVFLRTENDSHVFFLDHGDGGVNPCVINGIEGELQKLNGSYYFKRNRKGERLAIEEGTQFKTHGMIDANKDDVLVIFAGTNDLPSARSVSNIISLEKNIIEYTGCDKYIIIGLTYAGGIPEIDKVNEAMAKEFSDHFVDIRQYMLRYALSDVGITPTAEDIADIKKGEIPGSLRSDYVHGNKLYHRVLGEQVYRRMQYLGYCK